MKLGSCTGSGWIRRAPAPRGRGSPPGLPASGWNSTVESRISKLPRSPSGSTRAGLCRSRSSPTRRLPSPFSSLDTCRDVDLRHRKLVVGQLEATAAGLQVEPDGGTLRRPPQLEADLGRRALGAEKVAGDVDGDRVQLGLGLESSPPEPEARVGPERRVDAEVRGRERRSLDAGGFPRSRPELPRSRRGRRLRPAGGGPRSSPLPRAFRRRGRRFRPGREARPHRPGLRDPRAHPRPRSSWRGGRQRPRSRLPEARPGRPARGRRRRGRHAAAVPRRAARRGSHSTGSPASSAHRCGRSPVPEAHRCGDRRARALRCRPPRPPGRPPRSRLGGSRRAAAWSRWRGAG